jgi:hypothetical protein
MLTDDICTDRDILLFLIPPLSAVALYKLVMTVEVPTVPSTVPRSTVPPTVPTNQLMRSRPTNGGGRKGAAFLMISTVVFTWAWWKGSRD